MKKRILLIRLVGLMLVILGSASLLAMKLYTDFNRFYFPVQKYEISWIEVVVCLLLVLYGVGVIVTGRFKVCCDKQQSG